MSNFSMVRADRATHLRIVVVSLIAGILVVGVGISARTPGALQTEDNAVGVKALKVGKPAAWSSRETATIR